MKTQAAKNKSRTKKQKSFPFAPVLTLSTTMEWGTKEGFQQEKSLDNPTKITYNINTTNNGEASERT